MVIPTPRGVLATLVLVACGLLLPSCGGGGGGGGGAGDPEETGFRIVESSPRHKELAVALDRTLALTFSEEVDVATLDDAAVSVRETYTDDAVAGALTLLPDMRTARFVAAAPLALNTRYRIVVTTGVASRTGDPLKKEFESWFHTVVTSGEGEEEEEEPPPGRLVEVGPMAVGRSHHTSTRLPSGRVLVAGGFKDANDVTASAEIYDPAIRTFSTLTKGLWIARANHQATLLGNGLVLVTGGMVAGGTDVTGRCELFDPSDGSFTMAPDMTRPRAFHQATRLTDGRVLITGGADMNASGSLVSSSTAEIYDPDASTFTALGDMAVSRSDHRATRLLDGRVLVTGGSSWSTTADLFDPGSGTFTTTSGRMASARSGHSSTLLVPGDVLIYGGGSKPASIFRVADGTFETVTDLPLYDRTWHTADITAGGRVTIAGGWTQDLTLIFHASLESYYGPPAPDDRFEAVNDLFEKPRVAHRSTVLANGDILYTGGINVDPSGAELSEAAIYTFR